MTNGWTNLLTGVGSRVVGFINPLAFRSQAGTLFHVGRGPCLVLEMLIAYASKNRNLGISLLVMIRVGVGSFNLWVSSSASRAAGARSGVPLVPLVPLVPPTRRGKGCD